MVRSSALAFFVTALAACSDGETSDPSGSRPSKEKKDDAGSVPNDPGGFGAVDAGTVDAGDENGCSEAAKLVYVVGYEDRGLYSFAPDKLAFKRIGTVSCTKDPKNLPRSMAVDRKGIAWINHLDGRIYKVDTKDASCVDSGYEAPSSAWRTVNMGFASNSPGSSDETLYVVNAGLGTRGLAKIDPNTLKLTPIGDFSGELAGIAGELTGTGSARLFGFFKTMGQMTFSELDPKNAASIGQNVKVQGTLVTPSTAPGYAFSFWGGDFWFYVATSEHPASKVIRYKASGDKSQAVVLDDVGGFQIVGAGVSTCAPTTPTVK